VFVLYRHFWCLGWGKYWEAFIIGAMSGRLTSFNAERYYIQLGL
jgi:hypothetical protein